MFQNGLQPQNPKKYPLRQIFIFVPYAVQSLNLVETTVNCTKFLPDALDMTVNRTIIDIDVIAISRINKLISRFDQARPYRQRPNQKELCHGQGNLLAIP